MVYFTVTCRSDPRTRRLWFLLIVPFILLVANQSALLKRAMQEYFKAGDERVLDISHLSPFPSHKQNKTGRATYDGASVETYIMENLKKLGYETKGKEYAKGCEIWNDGSDQAKALRQWQKDLEEYQAKLKEFQSPHKDIRKVLHKPNICNSLQVSSDQNLSEMFRGQLSKSHGGLIEPLFPPLRSPSFCDRSYEAVMELDFLIHDFVEMCHGLTTDSRIVFFDLGASLQFHARRKIASPALYIPETFRKFGMPFDHIYAFELTKTPPSDMYDSVPNDLKAAYHWYNVGVSAETNSTRNPWNFIRENFHEDDLVVVKLDIDTPAVELPLAKQLLEDPELHKLVDHFYFEHHVYLSEIRHAWGPKVEGSVADSLRLFQGLRKAGIAAHSWV